MVFPLPTCQQMHINKAITSDYYEHLRSGDAGDHVPMRSCLAPSTRANDKTLFLHGSVYHQIVYVSSRDYGFSTASKASIIFVGS